MSVCVSGADQLLSLVLQWIHPERADPEHRHLRAHRLREDHPDRESAVLHRPDRGDARGERPLELTGT